MVFRCWWEVPLGTIGMNEVWAFCQNGSPYSPYYYPTYFVIRSDKGTFDTVMTYLTARIPNADRYWKPGLAYGKRTWEMYCYPMPCEQVITQEGNALFPLSPQQVWHGLAVGNSILYSILTNLVAGQHKYAGYLNTICLDNSRLPDLSDPAKEIYFRLRQIDSVNELSHAFDPASLVQAFADGHSWEVDLKEIERHIEKTRKAIDDSIFDATGENRAKSGRGPSGGSCFSAITDSSPSQRTIAEFGMSMFVGIVFGRWDVRYAMGIAKCPGPIDPFDKLDAYSPAMLRIEKSNGTSVDQNEYPLCIKHDAITPDDPAHLGDIVRRVREVTELIWNDRAESIEKHACEILGFKELRDYFRKNVVGGFWDDHVKCYSKSRRKAPIYWLLQSSKKNYALWLYYHKFDKDTLFKALQRYVEPKIRLEADELNSFRAQRAGTSGKDAKTFDRQIEKQDALLSELHDFEEKLRRAANLHIEPDLNDGVVLNIAPLWELVPWKEAKAYWDDLLAGKYEWSTIGKQLRTKGLV